MGPNRAARRASPGRAGASLTSSPRGRAHTARSDSACSPGRWSVPAPCAVPALLTVVAHRPCRHHFWIAEESIRFTFLCFFSSPWPDEQASGEGQNMALLCWMVARRLCFSKLVAWLAESELKVSTESFASLLIGSVNYFPSSR